MSEIYGYNLAREALAVQGQVFDKIEGNIANRLEALSLLNEQNRDLQKLINALMHAKKEKKADFNNDEEVKKAIDAIRAFAPDVLGHVGSDSKLQYAWENEEEIETALQLLDSQVKTQVSEVNKLTMFINQDYEDRIQHTDIAQKTLDMLIRHTDSIIAKQKQR